MCLQLVPSQVSPVWKNRRAEGLQGQHLNKHPLAPPPLASGSDEEALPRGETGAASRLGQQ